MLEPGATALLVIDMQQGFEEVEAQGAERNNPGAEDRVARLLAAFRGARAAVIHVRHASRERSSVFRPERPGFAPIAAARERDGETVIVKHANSAFIGTDLEARLRRSGIRTLVLVGATTNHCVESTARMAGNLGFDTRLVQDATWTFGRVGPDGWHHRADDIHRMSLANLSGEFATVTTTAEIIAALPPAGAPQETEP